MIKYKDLNKKYIISFIVTAFILFCLINVSSVTYAKENAMLAVQNQENQSTDEKVINVEVDENPIVEEKEEGVTFILKMIVLLILSLSIAFIINFILARRSCIVNSTIDNNALINSKQEILYVNNNEVLIESKRV